MITFIIGLLIGFAFGLVVQSAMDDAKTNDEHYGGK